MQMNVLRRYLVIDDIICARWLKWLEREFTDRKVRGSNTTSAPGPPLSSPAQPGSIPALELPSGGMAARHRRRVTAEHRIRMQNGKFCVSPYKPDGFRRAVPTQQTFNMVHSFHCNGNMTHLHYRSAAVSFGCLTAVPPERCMRCGILPGCPSLNKRSQEAGIGFEPRTFRSVNSRSNHLGNLAPTFNITYCCCGPTKLSKRLNTIKKRCGKHKARTNENSCLQMRETSLSTYLIKKLCLLR
ncbi:hypothetical protein CSKR_108814 [Clonorchis sinensis]|uniref:Uncharacterized protein n=1 Tax=Clonorchis sinensis TaxID=79923 RepID=A0A3R7HAZ3_CLOSI|nr:hypothetical protein CSKR_108814 [Clonorchis sinensis]